MPEGMTVLHVDDDADFADLTAEFLPRHDDRITTVTASSVADGVERFRDGDIDCVVSDYDMPDRTGLDLLERVREVDETVPFILFTGKGSEDIASRAFSGGATDYLRKTSGTDQYALLANRIVKYVERARARVQRRRHLNAIESAQEGIGILGEDGEFIYVNDAYADLYGYAPEEMVGEHWELIYPEDEVAFAREEILPTVESEGEWEGETTGLRADGTTFIEGHTISKTGTGELVCTVVDITDWKQGSEERDRYRAIVEALDDPVYVLDGTGRFLYVNDAFVDLVGYDSDTVIGATPDLIKSDAAVERAESHLGRLLSADGPDDFTFEVDIQTADGETVTCEDHMGVLPSDGDEFRGSVGVLRDISDRKRYERELREEQVFVEQCLNALDDVFYVFDADGNLLRWNDRLTEVTGYPEDRLVEMEPMEFFPEAQRERVAAAVETVLETGSATIRADYLTADGERRPHEFTGHRLTGPDGEVVGFAGVARDISEQLEYERRLEEQNERLDEFATMLSHDLRTPLSAATGHLELAREERESDHLDAVADAHDRIQTLVEDLLTLAREGNIAMDRRPVSLADCAESSWRTTETAEASLELSGDVTVLADESRLQQLLENLTRNAVDHAGPAVTVEVGPLEDRDGFYVADDGPGIPEPERDQVFDTGYTTDEDGIGVGLSIVDRVVKAHGWDIEVDESDAGGARFEISDVDLPDR